eukprot:Gb_22606 [translate_table: standard]
MESTGQALRFAEALTMPRVQVVVLNANMRCHECRQRVSQVLSKMDILMGYGVDVTQRKVTVKGRVDLKKRMRRLSNENKRKSIEIERLEISDRGKKQKMKTSTALDQSLAKIASFLRRFW